MILTADRRVTGIIVGGEENVRIIISHQTSVSLSHSSQKCIFETIELVHQGGRGTRVYCTLKSIKEFCIHDIISIP